MDTSPPIANDKAMPYETVRGADGLLYRRTAQVFIMNEYGLFLAFTPVGRCNTSYVQPIQGGLDRHETAFHAAVREAAEEAQLNLYRDARFVGSITLLEQDGVPSPGGAVRLRLEQGAQVNARGEVGDETRREFRYRSKSWRTMGIAGQEIYPFLFPAPSSVIDKVNTHPRDASVRQEFTRVQWVPLPQLVEQAPPSKRRAMQHVCAALHVYINSITFPS